MKKVSITLFLALLIVTSGCGPRAGNMMMDTLRPLRGANADNEAYQMMPFPDVSKPLSDPEKCRIYLIRDSYAGLQMYDVYDNGSVVGILQYHTYLCWDRPPGEMTITCSHSSHKTLGDSKQTFTVEAGKTYYIKLSVSLLADQSLGFLGGVKMKTLDEKKSKKALKKCTAPQVKNIVEVTTK